MCETMSYPCINSECPTAFTIFLKFIKLIGGKLTAKSCVNPLTRSEWRHYGWPTFLYWCTPISNQQNLTIEFTLFYF